MESSESGSLMSYCNRVTASFHPLTRDIMKLHASAHFGRIESAPEQVKLNAAYQVGHHDFFSFDPVLSATSYLLSIAQNSDFSDETITELAFSGFPTSHLSIGTDYYVRIKAVNALGTSDWSAVSVFSIFQKAIGTPIVTAPVKNNRIVEVGNPTQLLFSQVAGAAEYEIQITNILDLPFS